MPKKLSYPNHPPKGYRFLVTGDTVRSTDLVYLESGLKGRTPVVSDRQFHDYTGHTVVADTPDSNDALYPFLRKKRGNPKFGKQFGNGSKFKKAANVLAQTHTLAGSLTVTGTGTAQVLAAETPLAKATARAGNGYRILGPSERLQSGDSFFRLGYEPNAVNPVDESCADCYLTAGKLSAALGVSSGLNHVSDPVYIRRKVDLDPAFNAAAGYRLLVRDEVIVEGDEVNGANGKWVESFWHKPMHFPTTVAQAQAKCGDETFYVRRKVEAAAAAPAPAVDYYDYARAQREATDAGDANRPAPTPEQLDKDFVLVTEGRIQRHDWLFDLGRWAMGLIGDPVADCRVYRRKPAPATPATPSPGPGYRLLTDTDVVQRGDEWTSTVFTGDWRPAAFYLGKTVAAVNFMRRTPRTYRRPFVETPAGKTTIPPGHRELKAGETILATDQYLWGKEWLTRSGTKNVGTSYKPGTNRTTVRALAPAPSGPGIGYFEGPVVSSSTGCLSGGRSVKVERNALGEVLLTLCNGYEVRRLPLTADGAAALSQALLITAGTRTV